CFSSVIVGLGSGRFLSFGSRFLGGKSSSRFVCRCRFCGLGQSGFFLSSGFGFGFGQRGGFGLGSCGGFFLGCGGFGGRFLLGGRRAGLLGWGVGLGGGLCSRSGRGGRRRRLVVVAGGQRQAHGQCQGHADNAGESHD